MLIRFSLYFGSFSATMALFSTISEIIKPPLLQSIYKLREAGEQVVQFHKVLNKLPVGGQDLDKEDSGERSSSKEVFDFVSTDSDEDDEAIGERRGRPSGYKEALEDVNNK